MLRNVALAGAVLALSAASSFVSAAEDDFYVLKATPDGACYVSPGPDTGSEISITGPYQSHSRAVLAMQVNAACGNF